MGYRLIDFLCKQNLDLEEDHFQTLRQEEIKGSDLLNLTKEELLRVCGIELGPATRIIELVNKIKGGEQGKYHDHIRIP